MSEANGRNDAPPYARAKPHAERTAPASDPMPLDLRERDASERSEGACDASEQRESAALRHGQHGATRAERGAKAAAHEHSELTASGPRRAQQRQCESIDTTRKPNLLEAAPEAGGTLRRSGRAGTPTPGSNEFPADVSNLADLARNFRGVPIDPQTGYPHGYLWFEHEFECRLGSESRDDDDEPRAPSGPAGE